MRLATGTLDAPMASPRDSASSTIALDSGTAPEGVAVRAPLISTKLRAPAVGSGYRERPRIGALLDRGLEDSARLKLLSAPPGYGKTVAATGGWRGDAGPVRTRDEPHPGPGRRRRLPGMGIIPIKTHMEGSPT